MIIEVKVPSPGESITEVEIETWLVEDGASVEMDDELAEIASDKATLTVNAEISGVITITAQEGDTVKVGQSIATINGEGVAKTTSKEGGADDTSQKTPTQDPPKKESYASGHPSVSANKLMKENNVNQKEVQGTGRDGRITKTDVVNHLDNKGRTEPIKVKVPKKEAPKKEEPKKQSRPIPSLPQVGGTAGREIRRERMAVIRRRIAERLVSVKNETAMLTTFNEVDMKAIVDLRKKYKESFKKKYGVGLGYMSFFTKACSMALMEYPAVNSQIDGKDILYHNYADIGIAVSSPRGLVVPVIRNTQLMSMAQIEQSVLHYALKSRANEITIADMTGGTFTITNGGIFGSMLSTPIINPPQVAILGMHNIVQRPVAVNGAVEVRPVMYVALSYDHRVIDGKEAVSFLYRIKELLEDPSRMLIGI